MNLTVRVEALERQLKHARYLCFVLVMLVVLVVCSGQAFEGRDIEARSLSLRDESGRIRVLMTAPQEAGAHRALTLFDEKGEAWLTAGLSVSGEAQLNLGASDGASLKLSHGKQKRIVLAADVETTSAALYNREGKPRVRLDEALDIGSLSIFDRKGNSRVTLGTATTGEPLLALSDSDTVRVALGRAEILNDGGAIGLVTVPYGLTFLDERRAIIATLPR